MERYGMGWDGMGLIIWDGTNDDSRGGGGGAKSLQDPPAGSGRVGQEHRPQVRTSLWRDCLGVIDEALSLSLSLASWLDFDLA